MSIRIDDSRMPLVVVTWDGTCTDDEMVQYLAKMSELVRRPDRRALIFDASRASLPNATQRRLQGVWLKENEERIGQKTLGTAFVIESAVVRGGLTAVFWVQGMTSQHLVCATLSEALAWTEQRLGEAGLKVPPAALSSAAVVRAK